MNTAEHDEMIEAREAERDRIRAVREAAKSMGWEAGVPFFVQLRAARLATAVVNNGGSTLLALLTVHHFLLLVADGGKLPKADDEGEFEARVDSAWDESARRSRGAVSIIYRPQVSS